MSKLDDILAQPKVMHDLAQGTPEWDLFRLNHRGASEAAAMLGLSKNVTRSELLRMKHTSIAREFSDWVQANILDKGHAVEAKARAIIEDEIGGDLYPITCSRGSISASCDGVPLDDAFVMEHKQWAEELAASVRDGIVPEEHMPQCQQILMVTGIERVLFVVSDGTADKRVTATVLPDRAWWERIAAGWAQFEDDLAAYTPTAAVPAVVAAPVQSMPAVTVLVEGSITIIDNFPAFEQAVRDFLEHRLIREPRTDQDFATLDVQIKAMKAAESQLDAAEGQMLAQIQTVDRAKKTKDMLAKLVRDNRLMAEKLLASEKERRRGEIVAGGVTALREHIRKLDDRLQPVFSRVGVHYMPTVPADFGGAIKGKKSLASMEDAVATELARAKITAHEIADRIQANLAHLAEHEEHAHLFPDVPAIVQKASDDLQALVAQRIATHRAAEERRIEADRERIRTEEADKLRREQEEQRQREIHERNMTAANELVGAIKQAEGGPIATTAPVSSSPNVVPLQQRAAPVANTPPTLTIGEINRRLNGYGLTAATLARLGFNGVRERGATLFHETDFPRMCDAIVTDVRMAQSQFQQQAA